METNQGLGETMLNIDKILKQDRLLRATTGLTANFVQSRHKHGKYLDKINCIFYDQNFDGQKSSYLLPNVKLILSRYLKKIINFP